MNRKFAEDVISDKAEIALQENTHPYYKIISSHKPGSFKWPGDSIIVNKETASRWQKIYDAFMQMQYDIEEIKYKQIDTNENLENYDKIYSTAKRYKQKLNKTADNDNNYKRLKKLIIDLYSCLKNKKNEINDKLENISDFDKKDLLSKFLIGLDERLSFFKNVILESNLNELNNWFEELHNFIIDSNLENFFKKEPAYHAFLELFNRQNMI